jgi:hypothetical protein
VIHLDAGTRQLILSCIVLLARLSHVIDTASHRQHARPRGAWRSHSRSVAVCAILAACATALACAGCGFGPKVAASPANLRVTGDFGAHTVTDVSVGAAGKQGRQTDLDALERHAKVKTRPSASPADGGPTVTSIDGRPTSTGSDHWFFYVNGVQPTHSAAAFTVNKGDHLWWDLHDAQAADRVPAVVGSFPEPFLNGLFGRRYPSTIECGPGMKAVCASITQRFTHFHIPLSPAGVGYGSGTDSLSINVGTWDQVDGEVVAGLIAKGTDASGVYAHFTDAGRRLALENEAGHVVRTLGAGAGLVAATTGPSDVPTWVITGTDHAGVVAAARAMTVSSLAGHFALVVQGAHHYPVPTVGES